MEKITILNGAGINLEASPVLPYPENDWGHFLYLGRLMAEKDVGELLPIMKRQFDKQKTVEKAIVSVWNTRC